MRKLLYYILALLLLAFLWYLYAFFFLRINEEMARNKALEIIKSRYSMYCGGEFEKHLQLEIDWYNEKYEFTANNWRCTVIIYMDDYWAYDLAEGPN